MATAQATGQVRANLTFDWLVTERLTYEVDLEPTAQPVVHPGQPTWVGFAATPHVDYVIAPWIDVLGEVHIGVRHQDNDISTTTVIPRIGVRLHILSRILTARAPPGAEREKPPRFRFVASTLLRLEDPTRWSSADSSASSSWRFRDRFRIDYPLNRPKTTVDGAVYMTSDAELFVPITHTVPGGAVSELRVRTGIGYRPTFAWRVETLYVWTGQRSEQSGLMAVRSHAIDLRVRWQF